MKKKKKFKLDNHTLIPKHTKISEKEKEKLLKSYNISLRELPKIFKTDASIQKLNAKSGDIIKIIRYSPTSKESVYYRVVVDV